MNRTQLERKLARELAKVETEFLRRLVDELGHPPMIEALSPQYWDDYARAIRHVLMDNIQGIGLSQVAELMDQIGIGIDVNDVVADVISWSDSAVAQLVEDMVAKTKNTVDKLVRTANINDYTQDEFINRLAYRFGPVHAEMVAVTEVTRALTWATHELQAGLARQGINTFRRWVTAEDDKVCPICAPLDNTTLESGAWERAGLPDGPPAHPRCRCMDIVELADGE